MRRLAPWLALVAACSGPTPAVSSTAIGLTEGSITIADPVLAVGTVSLDIVNTGQFGHTLVVTTDAGVVVAATGLVAPGASATLDVTLAPGGYQFSCRIVSVGGDGELLDHYQMGMRADVEARKTES